MRFTKLNRQQVGQIRKRCQKPGWSYNSLAKEYGVSRIAIFKVVHNQTWTSRTWDPKKANIGSTGRAFTEENKVLAQRLNMRGWKQKHIGVVFGSTGAGAKKVLPSYPVMQVRDVLNPSDIKLRKYIRDLLKILPEAAYRYKFVDSLAEIFDAPHKVIFAHIEATGVFK